jgi:hypothetical protein
MFELLRRFPDVSLPYESTVTPTNVTRQYDVYLEIPRLKVFRLVHVLRRFQRVFFAGTE